MSRVKRRQSQRILFIYIVMVTLATMLAFGGAGAASPTTTITVDPKFSGKAPNESFSINIAVSDVTEIDGWQFNLTFNSAILQAVSVVEGTFLQQAGDTWWLAPTINNASGWVFAGCSLFPYPAQGASGGGVLATVTFKAINEGKSPFSFSLDQTKLRNWDPGAGVLVPVYYVAVDGVFEYPVTVVLVHDVAVTAATASPSSVLRGEKVSVNVTVLNRGNATETFDVSLIYGYIVIGTQSVISLSPGTSKVLVFTWETGDVPVGDHVLIATANTVSGETKTTDNVSGDIAVEVAAPSTLPLELLLFSIVAVVAVAGSGTLLYLKHGSKKK